MAWTAAPAATLGAVLILLSVYEARTECKNCIALDNEGRSLLRAHWEACRGGSGGDVKRQTYCALRRCKLLAKGGKLRKAALAHAVRGLTADIVKVLERCSNQMGDTPEDLAWNIFRCAFDHKSLKLNLPAPTTEAKGAPLS